MSGTYTLSMGDRGRIVIPAEVRERWRPARTGAEVWTADTTWGRRRPIHQIR